MSGKVKLGGIVVVLLLIFGGSQVLMALGRVEGQDIDPISQAIYRGVGGFLSGVFWVVLLAGMLYGGYVLLRKIGLVSRFLAWLNGSSEHEQEVEQVKDEAHAAMDRIGRMQQQIKVHLEDVNGNREEIQARLADLRSYTLELSKVSRATLGRVRELREEAALYAEATGAVVAGDRATLARVAGRLGESLGGLVKELAQDTNDQKLREQLEIALGANEGAASEMADRLHLLAMVWVERVGAYHEEHLRLETALTPLGAKSAVLMIGNNLASAYQALSEAAATPALIRIPDVAPVEHVAMLTAQGR